jgi:hypothetical protein
MRTIKIHRAPVWLNGEVHPEAMRRALDGLSVPFDLDRAYALIGRRAGVRLPPAGYLPIPLMDVVEALGARNRIDAMIYWRDIIRPHYIAVPVALCTLNETEETA